MTPTVAKSGVFSIGGTLPVHRLGFGAMRITGDGIWGPPKDEAEAIRVLQRLADQGIDFIDTADSYGPKVSEELIAKALHPYRRGLVIATKAGLTRPGPNRWVPNGRPEYLRQCAEDSLRRLKLERIPLWQLHRIDPAVPRAEQLEAVAQLQKDGLVEHLGLSEVSVADIEEAQRYFTVATVQNVYNLVYRLHEEVLAHCTAKGIGFIPWYPLAAGSLAKDGSLLAGLAQQHGVTTSAVALAWVLKKSPVMLPIPGTGRVAHLDENARAAEVELTDDDFRALDEQGQAEFKRTGR